MNTEEIKNELKELVKKHTEFNQTGFSINIEDEMEKWDYCLKSLGVSKGYQSMADFACELYKEQFHEEFLFSNACVAHEIAYHADCFFNMKGLKGYTYNTAAIVLPKQVLIDRCRIIDIYTTDTNSFIQSTVFDYRHGIRDCYKGTDKDPYK